VIVRQDTRRYDPGSPHAGDGHLGSFENTRITRVQNTVSHREQADTQGPFQPVCSSFCHTVHFARTDILAEKVVMAIPNVLVASLQTLSTR
jgi:hypothetical protein